MTMWNTEMGREIAMEYQREAVEDCLDRCYVCGGWYEGWKGETCCKPEPMPLPAGYVHLLTVTAPKGAARAARLGVYVAVGMPPVKAKVAVKDRESCTRCGGAGVLPHFYHVENGVCFRCEGRGVEPTPAARKVPVAALSPAEEAKERRKDAMYDADVEWASNRVGPQLGTWASIAMMMAEGDTSGFDWNQWKDEMKGEG